VWEEPKEQTLFLLSSFFHLLPLLLFHLHMLITPPSTSSTTTSATMDQFKAFSSQLNPLAAKLGKQFGQVKQVKKNKIKKNINHSAYLLTFTPSSCKMSKGRGIILRTNVLCPVLMYRRANRNFPYLTHTRRLYLNRQRSLSRLRPTRYHS
jgi:hypothetical protein